MPTLSVVLPFHNAEPTLPRAILSVLKDADEGAEIIAIDDGSTDGSAAIGAAIDDPRLRLISSATPGLVGALNTGIAASSGALIARMDADDETLPGRFAAQRSLLQNPALALVGTQVRAVGGLEGLARYVDWQNTIVDADAHHRALFIESPLCHPSVMMRRSALESVGGYRNGDFPEDYDLWLRMNAAGFGIAKVPQVLFHWHHRAGRATFSDPRYRIEAFQRAKAPFVARRITRERRTIAMWGAGRTGRRMMRALEPHGVRASLFVDIDPKKVGRIARGVLIEGPDALDPATHFVLAAVGARGARDEIRAFLKEREFAEGHDFLFLS
ncbi:MAG: glycosyltransferase [Myxococcota bacterium]